jgi:hypothetical protein
MDLIVNTPGLLKIMHAAGKKFKNTGLKKVLLKLFGQLKTF